MEDKPRRESKFANFLIKIFIRDDKELNTIVKNKKYSRLASLYALVTNIILFSLKIVFSFIFSLETLRADAINNASDIGMCILSLIIVTIASKPASQKHPYGTSRFEYVGSFLIAIIVMLLAGTQIAGSATDIAQDPNWSKYPSDAMGTLNNNYEAFTKPFFYVPLIIMIMAFILKLTQYILLTDIGRRVSSMSLVATGKDARNDSLVSLMIAFSLILSPLISFNVDSITSILVSIIVFFSGINIAKEAADALLGVMPSKETIETFVNAISDYPIVLGIHDLEMNCLGYSTHAYVHVEVDSSLSIRTIRNEIDFLEKDIEKRTGIRTVVRIDPISSHDPVTDRYRMYVEQAAHEIDSDIFVNDFFAIVDSENKKNILLIFDLVLPYDLLSEDREVIAKIKDIVRSFTNDNLTFRIDIDDRSSDLLLLLKDNNKEKEKL